VKTQTIHIVFAGEAPDLRFLEVEGPDGAAVMVGRWAQIRGHTTLVIEAVVGGEEADHKGVHSAPRK
jgi:hypothetical protein